ncbi:MAG: NfeD family protein [Pseudomonadales bacterium]
MEILTNPNYWIIAALALMVAELVIPGGIVFFLGAACLIVAGALWMGLVSQWVSALTMFFIVSLALIITLRSFFTRFVGGDYSFGNTEEILDDLDEVVDVVKIIGPGESTGKIEYRGTVWQALGNGQTMSVGSKVKIVARENTTYLVEPVSENVVDQDKE